MRDGIATLPIAGELNIYRAAELKPLVLDCASRGAMPDLSAVSALDTAGVQLLLLAARTAEEQGLPLRLAEASPAARSVLALLGLEARFGLAPEAGGPA